MIKSFFSLPVAIFIMGCSVPEMMFTAEAFSPNLPTSRFRDHYSHNHHQDKKPLTQCSFPKDSIGASLLPLAYGRGSDENLMITSPVLKEVYPALLKYLDEYGHPNIPLGSKDGRFCDTLRRLHIQNKLNANEVEWLDSLGFRWHSLEDVYKYADFDELFERLMDYEKKHPGNNFQVPKKCKEDPELGAWVTGIRRLGKEGVNPQHERRLDSVGFAWKSTRKCGSKFMAQYRAFLELVDKEGLETVMKEDSTKVWIRAQQQALKNGKLGQTRVHYMGDLFGEDWTTI